MPGFSEGQAATDPATAARRPGRADKLWCASRPQGADARVSGSPAFWSAFGCPASSHRRGRSGGRFGGLRPRRWDAGSLLPSRENRFGTFLPGEPPLTFIGSRMVAGRRMSEKRQGRHARGRLLSLGPGSATIPVLGAAVLALADDPCRHVL